MKISALVAGEREMSTLVEGDKYRHSHLENVVFVCSLDNEFLISEAPPKTIHANFIGHPFLIFTERNIHMWKGFVKL